MNILTRKDAMMSGMTQYFTGEPCVNGHISYRYVQSGTCAACVRAAASESRKEAPAFLAQRQADRAARLAASEAKTVALAQLVDIKVRVFDSDAALLRDTAAALCRARYPALTLADVVLRKPATDPQAGTGLYRMLVHPDDIPMIRETANVLIGTHKVDIGARRHHILDTALKQANEGMAPPAWTEKP